MEGKLLNVAVCINPSGWHQRFADSLEEIARHDASVQYSLVNIDADNWQSVVEPFQLILWKPRSMGFEAASYLKEKVYFLEKFLGKIVVPNFDTIWHFDSKVAQQYIFRAAGVNTPRTCVSFDLDDALSQLETYQMPLVFKRPDGAGSSNVKLIQKKAAAISEIRRTFSRDVLEKTVRQRGSLLGKMSREYLNARSDKKNHATNHPVIYWQEFIPGNSRDLRVTAIGDKFAFGFWRNNRKNDFRASGSGDIDYQSPIPEEVVRFCLELNKRMNFDSMAYDIVYSAEKYMIVEMSYGYVDSAIHRAPGFFELTEGRMSFRYEHIWPQSLWVRWALDRLKSSQPHDQL